MATSTFNQDLVDKILSLRNPNGADSGEKVTLYKEGSPCLEQICSEVLEALLKESIDDETQQLVKEELSDIKGLPDHRAGEEQILKSLTRVSAAIDGDEIRSFTLVQCLERVIAHIQALQLTKYVKQKQSGLESSAEKIQNAEGGHPAGAASINEATEALREIAELLEVEHADSAAHQLRMINGKVQDIVWKLPDRFWGCILPEDSFNDSQRELLEHVFLALRREYTVRRKMLIERAKVTLQSMLWSEDHLESKGTLEEARGVAQAGQDSLLEQPEVELQDVFKACIGDVLAVTCKATSGDKGKFEATVKSILIGAVPDRGGRTTDSRAAAAAASMPAWAPRSTAKGTLRGKLKQSGGGAQGFHSERGGKSRGRGGGRVKHS